MNKLLGSVFTSEDESKPAQDKVKDKEPTATMRPWKAATVEKRKELEKYGFKVKSKFFAPSTEDGWNKYMEQRITEGKIFESEEAKEAIKGVQVTEREYQKKMAINREHEQEMKKLIAEDPFNEKYKKRLQNIYKVRAISAVMKDQIVIPEQFIVMDENITLQEN